MDITGVLVLILVILLLYVLIRYATDGSKVQTGIVEALKMQTVSHKNLAAGSVAASNFSHCIWFYIDDWNYNYGTYKPLLLRTPTTPAETALVPGLKVQNVCPAVILGSQNNTMDIFQTIFQTGNATSSNTMTIDGIQYNKCTVTNIPIQKWCCLIVSFYGRTCDIYLDGKLIRTCVMDGVAKVDKDADMYITPGIITGKGSFKGWTSNYQFFPNSTNPQQAYDFYKKGFGGNWLSNLLNMEVKVTFSKNGQVEKEFSF